MFIELTFKGQLCKIVPVCIFKLLLDNKVNMIKRQSIGFDTGAEVFENVTSRNKVNIGLQFLIQNV